MQEKAEQREAALGKAEKMLEEDVKRFDAFLRENAEKLQEAVSHAETQTKSKQEKVSTPPLPPFTQFLGRWELFQW